MGEPGDLLLSLQPPEGGFYAGGGGNGIDSDAARRQYSHGAQSDENAGGRLPALAQVFVFLILFSRHSSVVEHCLGKAVTTFRLPVAAPIAGLVQWQNGELVSL